MYKNMRRSTAPKPTAKGPKVTRVEHSSVPTHFGIQNAPWGERILHTQGPPPPHIYPPTPTPPFTFGL
jgi:hypothetical protein